MSPGRTRRRSWKQTLCDWGTVLFLCLLAGVAAVGVRVLIESVGDAQYERYEPVDVPPQSVSPRHEREREEYERRDRAVLEKER